MKAGKAAVAALLLMLGAAGTTAAEDHTPQPYSPDEFQPWMKDAWRAGAIVVGSFPFTLFATLETYDTVRFVSNNFSSSYAPWPFGSGAAVSYSAQETAWLIVSAVSLSAMIAGLDYLLGKIHERSPPH